MCTCACLCLPQDHPPVLNQQLDSSSNPSSTTSSTPSSPAAFSQGNLHNATPPPNPSPKGRDVRFNFPGQSCGGGGISICTWQLSGAHSHRLHCSVYEHAGPTACKGSYVLTSAVKRLKYLIAINRIFVIVNSKLIAIKSQICIYSKLYLFIYFFHHFIFILLPLSTWKSGLACFMQMFYFIENQYCQTGRYKIKL